MTLINYISSRFNRHRTLPGSVKAMRIVTIVGIAVASATLIVTLSILKGFEKEYKRTILDFNAHVVLMKAGEIDDKSEVMHLIERCELNEADREFLSKYKIPIEMWRWVAGLYRAYSNIHQRAFLLSPVGSWTERLLDKVKPRGIAALMPESVKRWNARVRELDLKGVEGVTPFIYREGLVIAHGRIEGVIIKGVDPRTLGQVNPMEIRLSEWRESLGSALNADEDEPPVILGAGLMRELEIKSIEGGEKVKLLVPTTVLKKGEDQFKQLSVVGEFESGLHDYDAQFALMSLSQVRSLFGIPGGKITGVELRLDDPEKASYISEWLENKLRGSWRVIPWNELNADIFRAVEMEERAFSVIMGMLVIVAAFNIIGVLVIIILTRAHEISLLRALGMTKRELTRVFTRGGLLMGLIGVIIGLAVGIGTSVLLASFDIVHIAPEIYFLSRLPIEISPAVCGIIVVFCLLVCWWTSRWASGRLAGIPICEGLSKTY